MSNRDRAAEIIYRTLSPKYGDFSHHEETADALDDAGLLADDSLLAQIERVREALAWAEQAESRAHADWIRTADTHHRDAALAYTQSVTWIRHALGGIND